MQALKGGRVGASVSRLASLYTFSSTHSQSSAILLSISVNGAVSKQEIERDRRPERVKDRSLARHRATVQLKLA